MFRLITAIGISLAVPVAAVEAQSSLEHIQLSVDATTQTWTPTTIRITATINDWMWPAGDCPLKKK